MATAFHHCQLVVPHSTVTSRCCVTLTFLLDINWVKSNTGTPPPLLSAPRIVRSWRIGEWNMWEDNSTPKCNCAIYWYVERWQILLLISPISKKFCQPQLPTITSCMNQCGIHYDVHVHCAAPSHFLHLDSYNLHSAFSTLHPSAAQPLAAAPALICPRGLAWSLGHT